MPTLKEIQDQIAELQKQAEELKQAQRQEVIEKLKSEIEAYQVTAKELGFKKSKPVNSASKSKIQRPAKYKLNDNTWSGQGRPPKWYSDYINGGGEVGKILIK